MSVWSLSRNRSDRWVLLHIGKQQGMITYVPKGDRVMSGRSIKVCVVSDARKLDKFSQESRFVCERCGATAHSKSNVCVPVFMEPDH